jgi:hypothetical protein
MTKNKSILITQAVARTQEEIKRPDLECIQAVFVKNAIVLTWADKRSGQRVLSTTIGIDMMTGRPTCNG